MRASYPLNASRPWLIGVVIALLCLAALMTASMALADAPTKPSAQGGQATVVGAYTLPDTPIAEFQNALLPGTVDNDRKLLLGGIGSDLWRGSNDPAGEFWMITDRGPNGQIKVGDETRRTFPIPGFDPVILHVKVDGGKITVLKAIPIVTQSGKPATGLSNTDKRDETPYDYSAQTKLDYNPNGLDTEGLVRTANGDFWVCEEYSPSLLHLDAAGKVLKRYVPVGLNLSNTDYPVVGSLPAIYEKRKINRGCEALALSPDGKTLYLGIQSPLYNPDKKTGDASRNTRILAFDIATEKPVAEYVYRFEPIKDFDPTPNLAASEMKLSALAAIGPNTLLVDERTDNVAKIYKVDLSKATNILGTKWDDPATVPSLEATDDLAAAGATALPKALVVDLGTLPGVPGKIEGVAVVDGNTIAIANDNDFDIGDFDSNGNNKGSGSKSKILVVSLSEPLAATTTGAAGQPSTRSVPVALPVTGAAQPRSVLPAVALMLGLALVLAGVAYGAAQLRHGNVSDNR
ncbi:MAG: esterase-like activity of phytase family protein [Anaerolineae bacterium]